MLKKTKQRLRIYNNVNLVMEENRLLKIKLERRVKDYEKLSFDELVKVKDVIAAEYKAVLAAMNDKIEPEL